MKTIKYFSAILMALFVWGMSSCKDFDYHDIDAKGTPVVKATAPGKAEMGDSIDIVVNCADAEGYDLSTLTAELCYGDEAVTTVSVRTPTPGDYRLRLHVPFLRFVPNGTAQVRLTLQNVTTRKTVENVDLQVERPHFADLQFVTADGDKVAMAEGDDYTYACLLDIADNAFKGYFQTADGKHRFGWADNDVAENGQGYLSLQSNKLGKVTVTFNTRDFTFAPQEELNIQPLEFRNAAGRDTYTGTLTKGMSYKFVGDDAVQRLDWLYDTDFFTRNPDGTYLFNAITGTYTIKAVFAQQGFRIYAGDGKNPTKLNADGTGAVWIIGGDMFGKPTYAAAHSWWTGVDDNVCMAPVADKVYQATLTVGRQIDPGKNFDFKFFGQPGWGTEFKAGGDHALTTDNPWFAIDPGSGNVKLKDGVTLKKGQTFRFTVDLTQGCDKGVLKVEKSDDPTIEITQANATYTGRFVQGHFYQIAGDAALSAADWFYDSDFFIKNQDGSYIFKAVTGNYTVKAVWAQKGFRIHRMDEAGEKPAALADDGTGAIWIIGDAVYGKPTTADAQGWWTDTDHALCMTPVKPKVHQVTLTVGKQLKAGKSVNFKFFGQAGWGTEFKGKDHDHLLTTDNPTFLIGNGTGGHDNGNIYLADGAELVEGDTYVFTIDCSKGMKPATLTVVKK